MRRIKVGREPAVVLTEDMKRCIRFKVRIAVMRKVEEAEEFSACIAHQALYKMYGDVE